MRCVARVCACVGRAERGLELWREACGLVPSAGGTGWGRLGEPARRRGSYIHAHGAWGPHAEVQLVDTDDGVAEIDRGTPDSLESGESGVGNPETICMCAHGGDAFLSVPSFQSVVGEAGPPPVVAGVPASRALAL